MRVALKLGVHISIEEIRADEFMVMQILEEERDRYDREQLPGNQHGR